LKKESCFWLVLRNDTFLDRFSAILRISKDEKSQRIFASLGTFVLDENSNLIFKIFLKQQMINHSDQENTVYKENDLIRIKGNVIDTGEDKMIAKLFINDDRMENVIVGKFFLPFTERNKVMIAGNGASCNVKSFFAREKEKSDEAEYIVTKEKKNCECCRIF